MKRFLLGLAIFATMGFYLFNASELTDSGQYGVIVLLISESILFLWMPKKVEQKVIRKRRSSESNSIKSSAIAAKEEMDLPDLVTVDSLDGASLKERKMAKLKAISQEQESEEIGEEYDEELVEVKVEVDDEPEVHLAEEFVVEVSPQSIEDADIEDAVSDRLELHERIRKRIEERRRTQMADIRASTAKMWEDHDQSEDLLALLANPQHGLEILNEPVNVEPGHPYGSTFVRIDESKVLRLRMPLDSGFKAVGIEEEDEDLPVFIGPDGLPLPSLPMPGEMGLPPLPGAPGLPLPDLPLPSLPTPISDAQSALADMREDME